MSQPAQPQDGQPEPGQIPDLTQTPQAPVVVGAPGWRPGTGRRARPAESEPPAEAAGSSGTPTPPGTDSPPANERKLFGAKSRTFKTIAEAGLEAGGGLLNITAGTGTDAFIPDEDDLATVPPPVGRIIARRVSMSEDTNLSEAADMITAGIGLFAWLLKGLILVAQARLAARKNPAALPGQVIRPSEESAP